MVAHGQTDVTGSTAPSSRSESPSDTDVIQRSREYYFAILPDSGVYHVAHDGETLCRLPLYGRNRRYKRGSEQVIPPELRLCRSCDTAFHRELALAKAHIREEPAALAGVERQRTGPFSKRELAELLLNFRERPSA